MDGEQPTALEWLSEGNASLFSTEFDNLWLIPGDLAKPGKAKIEGSCNQGQPVAESIALYSFQLLSLPDELHQFFRLTYNFSKYIVRNKFDKEGKICIDETSIK
jgi:hypothetical protein